MPNFGNIVSLAYMRILGRLPDPGGLENFNQLMNAGMTEATMHEALLRSPEYAQKNPDTVRARVRSKAGKKRASRPRRARSGK